MAGPVRPLFADVGLPVLIIPWLVLLCGEIGLPIHQGMFRPLNVDGKFIPFCIEKS